MSCNCPNLQSLEKQAAEEYIDDYLIRIKSGKSIFACTHCRARWVLDYQQGKIRSVATSRIRKLPFQQEEVVE